MKKKMMSWEWEQGLGSAERLAEVAGPPRNIQKTPPTRSPLQVSSDNPPEQISLTSIILYGPHPEAGTYLLEYTERSVLL
jgi:hypothetical protein